MLINHVRVTEKIINFEIFNASIRKHKSCYVIKSGNIRFDQNWFNLFTCKISIT